LEKHPEAINKAEHPAWGPEGHFHHWGEPLLGYYTSKDAWVFRRHAEMLEDAGIDAIFFDATNQFPYLEETNILLDAFADYAADGGNPPGIVFLTPFHDPTRVVPAVYEAIYKPGVHSRHWFRWKGKPLILADPGMIDDPEILEFFTFRKPMPGYFSGPTGPNQWGWLEIHPQHAFYNEEGKAEQAVAGVGQNARRMPGDERPTRLAAFTEPDTAGRSWHDNHQDTRPGAVNLGLNFAEQWNRVLEIDPEFVFITGWNEWTAIRFQEFNGVEAPVVFVDQFTQEKSRDIEPMKGGHGDNYYYQMIDGIRRFKGARPVPIAGPPVSMDLSGSFDQWKSVTPAYADHRGDTMHRDSQGWGEAGRYIDTSGRNDFELLKVARDKDNLYFYARTAEEITSATEGIWMTLLLRHPGSDAPAWEGFHYAVNRMRPESGRCLIERSLGGWNWEKAAQAELRQQGRELMLVIPRNLIGTEKKTFDLDFKWLDNTCARGDIMETYTSGDAAPSGRFAFRYRVR
jgi:hypothetical protein